MNTKTTNKWIVALALVFQTYFVNAQFNQTTIAGTNLGRTNANIATIGIGNFTVVPSARLHVNNFYCSQPNGTLNGFLFRTDGNNNVENKWQIFTGTNAGNATEKFKLYVPSGTSHTVLQTSQNGGNLMFNTGGAITRMVIMDGGTGAGAGHVGIGNGLPQPTSRLHIHNNIAPTTSTPQVNYLQITIDAGNGTGSNGNDGFKIGVRSRWNATTSAYQSEAEIRQQENAPLNFFTFNTQKATILPNGNLGVGTPAPTSLLHLNDGANPTYMQVTNTATGSTVTDGFKVGIDNLGNAQLINIDPHPIFFSTNFGGTSVVSRMVIMDATGFVGISDNSPTPQSRLHIDEQKIGSPVYTQWTNQETTNNTDDDGFKIGVTGGNATNSGHGEVNQQENKDIIISTGNADAVEGPLANAERMRIIGTVGANQGFVGINDPTPSNRLEITRGVANESGLTFTNLTSGSPGATGYTKVLSVDAAGKVILVQGGAGGTTGAIGNTGITGITGPTGTTGRTGQQVVLVRPEIAAQPEEQVQQELLAIMVLPELLVLQV